MPSDVQLKLFNGSKKVSGFDIKKSDTSPSQLVWGLVAAIALCCIKIKVKVSSTDEWSVEAGIDCNCISGDQQSEAIWNTFKVPNLPRSRKVKSIRLKFIGKTINHKKRIYITAKKMRSLVVSDLLD